MFNQNTNTMKNVMIAIGLLVALSAFHLVEGNSSFTFNKTIHDFGELKLKVPATAEFEFENSSEFPIIILSAKGSCGCTVADYTKGEIQPGEKGSVSATYNAAKLGRFQKSVTVQPSVGDPIKLLIKGEVVE
jgi:urease beta subunit